MNAPNTNTFSPNPSVDSNHPPLRTVDKSTPVTVVGAGAFGGWTALSLLRKGFKVTLVDAWGAGNSRSSSGDETRVIRSTYGSNELYFNLNVRALELWKQHEALFNKRIFYNTGVLWLCYRNANPIVDESVPFARSHQMDYELITKGNLRQRFPLINVDDLSHAFFDPYGGYLKAREACQCVLELFVSEGGTYIHAEAKPGQIKNRRLNEVSLSNGSTIRESYFIFACGSWLPLLFPDLLMQHITCTKQEVYYFGVPEKCAAEFDRMPVWVDLDGEDFYYGIAGNASRGFKIGVDRRGPHFNPTSSDRLPDPQVLQHARNFIAHRFPELKNAPLIESRVCPYENSIAGNFIFDQPRDIENLFFLGGGSGHGFKHGPALGELVTSCLTGDASVPATFRIFT